MYRTAIEGILGIHLRGAVLRINPCIPRAWPGFEITYKYGSSRYHIAVENPQGVNRGIVRASLDEREISGTPCDIGLADDGSYHHVRITLGLRQIRLFGAWPAWRRLPARGQRASARRWAASE